MRKRTLAREFALQILYQMDIASQNCDDSLENFWQSHSDEELSPEVKDFANGLVRGVANNLNVIDARISQYAANWALKRMAFVDRNILRLSCFELLFCEEIPPKVSINEAINLAKKYSGVEAGKFVNGILDKIHTEKNA